MTDDKNKSGPPSVSDALSKLAAFVGAFCVAAVAGFFVLVASKSFSLAFMVAGGIVAMAIGLAGFSRGGGDRKT